MRPSPPPSVTSAASGDTGAPLRPAESEGAAEMYEGERGVYGPPAPDSAASAAAASPPGPTAMGDSRAASRARSGMG